jgi:hypothetical protein
LAQGREIVIDDFIESAGRELVAQKAEHFIHPEVPLSHVIEKLATCGAEDREVRFHFFVFFGPEPGVS